MKAEKSMAKKVELVKQSARKAMFLNTFIQITDNKKAVIENCKHIVECSDIFVRVATADYEVDIWGTNLTISDYNAEFVVVNGKISSLEINPKGRKATNDI